MQNLGFPNGVKLSDDESFILVAETLTLRIMKYHLKGPKTGQKETFIDGLPGLPDNIQSDGQGGFLITAVLTIHSEHPLLHLSLIQHPYLRKMIIRLLLLMELPFKLLHDIYPNTFAEKAMHAIGSFQASTKILNTYKKSLVLRLDVSGNIMEVLSSDDDTLHSISEAYIHNGFVWLGSPWLNYIARVPLKQAFPDLANNEKQSSPTRENPAASNVKSKKVKRDTISTSAPTVSKPTPTPTTTPKPTTSTTSKPTAASKPSPAPKVDKPTTIDNSNANPSKTKPVSKSASDAKVKKTSAETVNDAKSNTKSNSPNTKSETDNEKDAAKTDDKSEKSVKVEQDAFTKEKVQKLPPKKVKTVETNRLKDDL